MPDMKMQLIIEALDKSKEAFSSIEKALKDAKVHSQDATANMSRGWKLFDSTVESSAKNIKNQISSVTKELIAFFAVYKAADFTKDTALAGARYETLGIVVKNVGASAGYTSDQLDYVTASLQKNGIAMIESREVTTRMIQAQLRLTDATKLARIAQDAAVIGNINSSQAFEKMIYGIQSGQTDVLKTIGINVSFEQSYGKLADQLGVSAKSLNECQKMQARANAVMDAGQRIAGTYEAAMTTAGKQIKSFERYLDDFKVKAGIALGPATTQIIKRATEAIKELTAEVEKDDVQRSIAGIGTTAVNTFANIIKLSGTVASLFKDVLDGWNSLPPEIQTIGLIGAVFFGKKGVAAAYGASVLAGMVKTQSQGIAAASQGLITWNQFMMSSHDELKKLVDDAISEDQLARLKVRAEKLQSVLRTGFIFNVSENMASAKKELDSVNAQIDKIVKVRGSEKKNAGIDSDLEKSLAEVDAAVGRASAAQNPTQDNNKITQAREKAYNDMYDSLKFGADGYYQYMLNKHAAERTEYIKLTGDKLLADQAYAEKKKSLDEALYDFWFKDIDTANKKAKEDIDKAYNGMYDSLKFGAEGYYQYMLDKYAAERTEYIKLTCDKLLADQAYAEKKRTLDDELYNYWFKDIDEANKKAGEAARAARESEINQQLSALDIAEKAGTYHKDTLSERIRLTEELENIQEDYLKALDKQKDPASWYAQMQAIDATRSKLLDLNAELHPVIDALQVYAGEASDAWDAVGKTITKAFGGMEDALIDFCHTGKLNFKSLIDSIIDDVLRLMIRANITGPLAKILGGGGSGSTGGGWIESLIGYGSSLLGGLRGSADVTGKNLGSSSYDIGTDSYSWTGNINANAKGNIFSRGYVLQFATGGIFDKSTYFQMANGSMGVMGEAGPEAVMPLTRSADGKLGVRAAAAPSGNNVGISINVPFSMPFNDKKLISSLRAEIEGNLPGMVEKVVKKHM